MSKKTLIIDPITRISGLLEVQVHIENHTITEATCGGMQLRGFEQMLQGRPPLDAIYLTVRTCGICSLNHALTSTLALEDAYQVIPSPNGRLIRNICLGLEMLQNHLRHLCQFVYPDYVNFEGLSPVAKSNPSLCDFRLPSHINLFLVKDYFTALTLSRNAHTALAAFTGKAPHAHGVFVGGITTTPTIVAYEQAQSIIKEILDFATSSLVPNLYTLGDYYPEYYTLGKTQGAFLSYGLYDQPSDPILYGPRGTFINHHLAPLDIHLITESFSYSWFNAPDEPLPLESMPPVPNRQKQGAYSWVSAPRYLGLSLEGGPLARMTMSGLYNHGFATMDRLITRGLEIQKLCECLLAFLEQVTLEDFYNSDWVVSENAQGIGLTEACRGPLAHFIQIEKNTIKNYSLLPPSTWNLSPKDNQSQPGPCESALLNTPIQNIDHPVEIGRIVRSFDPCLNCAAHITSPYKKDFIIQVI
ncbi:Ni/Fe hydrogenase [Sporanaerobium hydrogeniformans]|uniref:Ni/Fe hydrogenase n=1 Tax=Sporanaerobium hydrogeniformans TaxID=3072179 RepID=A0AC61DI86_9FIRM|nr:nickel-dependent hydrogenase large subunit [Sporanaerobium hydrogeniformans]PHV71867.1 Ni/Fe hydrogenase [Sporanaerobium hydrogeniformans]